MSQSNNRSKNQSEPTLKPGFRKRSDALILALIAAKNEAFELELFGTAHAVDGATTKIGWEVADFMTGKRTALKGK